MLKQKYFLTGIFILSAERQPIKLAWRKIVWLHYNLYPSIAVISPATKNIEYIGGYKEYVDGTLFTFTFENDYTTIMTSKIEGVEGSRVPFLIAYQNLLP